MNKPDPVLFALQQMTVDLSLIKRRSYLAGTDKRENDVEHSLTVALLCWYLHNKLQLPLDIAKILKYAITHDFVERYAGDVNTFASVAEREQKVYRERDSLNQLTEEFSEFEDMITAMETYESKQDEESLFVWSVDKMQQLIMGDMDAWRCYAELPVSYDQFCAKYKELSDKSSKYSKDIFEGLIEYSKTTFYDQPGSKQAV